MRPFLRRGLFWTAIVVGLAADASTQGCKPVGCGRIGPGPLPERLRRVASLNWREADRATIAREWPEANLCPPNSSSPVSPSLEDAYTELERCCKENPACGGPVFTAPIPATTGLWAIDLALCRSSKRLAFDALAELVAAVAPEQPKAKALEDWSPSDSSKQSRYMVRWTTAEDTFVLEAFVWRGNESWMGRFNLQRRWQPDVRETWTLDDGSLVRILSIETTGSSDSQGKVLRLGYLTECLAIDLECLDRETSRLWPRLRSLAERQGVREVSLWIDDCVGYRQSRNAQRGANGEWAGTLPSLVGTRAKP